MEPQFSSNTKTAEAGDLERNKQKMDMQSEAQIDELPGTVQEAPFSPSEIRGTPQETAKHFDEERDRENKLPFEGSDTVDLPLSKLWKIKMAKLRSPTSDSTPEGGKRNEFHLNPDFQVREWQPGLPLELFCGTWNMAQNESKIEEVSSHFITPNAHIIVICTQENGPYVGLNISHKRWEERVSSTLPSYTRIESATLWAVHMMVFVRTADVLPYVCEIHSDSVKTGSINNAMGNKGGVGIAFSIRMFSGAFSRNESQTSPAEKPTRSTVTTFLFVGAHLTAHQENHERRNEDYLHIVRHLKLGAQGMYEQRFLKRIRRAGRSSGSPAVVPRNRSTQSSTYNKVSSSESDTNGPQPQTLTGRFYSPLPTRDVTEEFDVCCFLGDLNYRINGTASAIRHIIKNHSHLRAALTANDQLTQEMQKGIVFHGFEEMPLVFCPTYKLRKIKTTAGASDSPPPSASRGQGQPSGSSRTDDDQEYDFCSDNSDVSSHAKRKKASTYDSDQYQDGPKARMPAYCDRVLVKANFRTMGAMLLGSPADRPPSGVYQPSVKLRLYTDVRKMTTSDHRPVALMASVDTFSADDGESFEHDNDPPHLRVGC